MPYTKKTNKKQNKTKYLIKSISVVLDDEVHFFTTQLCIHTLP